MTDGRGRVPDDAATDDDPIHVVGVPGSLREASRTRVALRHALDAAESLGATTDLIDLRTLELPLFDASEKDAGDAPELRARIRAGDAVVLDASDGDAWCMCLPMG